MLGYPLDLILAVATASATVFLGFLPTKSISSSFFAREALVATFLWAIVAFSAPAEAMHYMLAIGLFCGGAWWKFRHDRMLNGKMWLSLSSGLGISLAVVLILVKTPQGYPPELPSHIGGLLLASIYLGGSIIGLTYICFTLIQNVSTNSGVTQGVAQRYLKILFGLTLARAAVLIALLFLPRPGFTPFLMSGTGGGMKGLADAPKDTVGFFFGHAFVMEGSFPHSINMEGSIVLLLALVVIALPGLAYAAVHASRMASRVQPTRILIVLLLAACIAEIIARLVVL